MPDAKDDSRQNQRLQLHRSTLFDRLRRTVAHRKWLLVAGLVLGLLAGAAFAIVRQHEFTATATVLIRPSADRSDAPRGDPETVVATTRELLALPRVAQATGELLGRPQDAGQIADDVEIDSPPNTNVTRIKARGDSASEAADLANAYATAAARQSESIGGAEVTVVQRAQRPGGASAQGIALELAVGALGGLLLGLLLAMALAGADRRLKEVEELEEIYELPVVSRIPRSRTLRKGSGQIGDEVLAEASGFSEEAEAFRMLRANLRYFNVDREVRSILVVSPTSGDGKSTTARYLATTMAAMGDRVVLVDADLRKRDPTAPGMELASNGLSLVLAGFELDDALQETPVAFDPVSETQRSFFTLASGPLPPNPSELLESERMRWVVRQLEARFDAVIIDSPALVTVSDALALVPMVSGVVIISGVGQTTRNAALGLRKQLDLLNGRQLGVVANFWTSTAADSYYYRYGPSGNSRRPTVARR